MSLITGDNLLIEEELKIVVIGEPSTGKVNHNNIFYLIPIEYNF